MSEEIVIAWDEGPYANHLRDKTSEDVSIATSKDNLEEELRRGEKGQYRDDACLVVLLEVNWEGQRSFFHGFELARELMMDGFTGPIVFCSFVRRKALYDLQNIGIGRLMAPMPFTFVQLPVAPETLVKEAGEAQAFSAMMQAYVCENDLVSKPLARIAHGMRGALQKSGTEMRCIVRRKLDDLKALGVNLPADIAEQRQAVDLALQKESVDSQTYTLVRKLKNSLEQHDPRRESDREHEETERADYAVLLVEDEEDYRAECEEALSSYFEEVTAVRNSEEALNELNNSDHKYLAVISDWVLHEEDDITWQPMQGFDLLAAAWEQNKPISLIALTSLNPEAVRSVLLRTDLDIRWFDKDDVGKGELWPYHAFAGFIKERVRSLLPDLENMPKFAAWTRHGLGDLFLELKYESGRWEQVRKKVEEMASRIVDDFVVNRVDQSPINEGAYNLELVTSTPVREMKKLEDILPQRLAVLAMQFEHRMEPIDIRCRLFYKDADGPENVEQQVRNWYPTLGISTQAKGIGQAAIFEHERDWLRRRYDRGQEEAERKMQQLQPELEELFMELDHFIPRNSQVTHIGSIRDAEDMLVDLARSVAETTRDDPMLARELRDLLNHRPNQGIWEECGTLKGKMQVVASLCE
jgi:CheY-like chemotaxis protein